MRGYVESLGHQNASEAETEHQEGGNPGHHSSGQSLDRWVAQVLPNDVAGIRGLHHLDAVLYNQVLLLSLYLHFLLQQAIANSRVV